MIGATGYIGEAICLALRREGYRVFGLTRSAQGASHLQSIEVEPIVCEPASTEAWQGVAEKCTAVIDCVGFLSAEHQQKLVAAIPKSCLHIFTSGCMSYGSAMKDLPEGALMDESSARRPSAAHAHGQQRCLWEDTLLASGAVVVRPGWVYGRSGGHYVDLFFGGINEEKKEVSIKGRGDIRYSWVHVDDVAHAYILILQHREEAAGHDFNVNASEYPSREEIVLAAAKTCGLADVPLQRIALPEDHHLEVNVKIHPKRAMELLGWKPRHVGFIYEMPLYYNAWKLGKKH